MQKFKIPLESNVDAIIGGDFRATGSIKETIGVQAEGIGLPFTTVYGTKSFVQSGNLTSDHYGVWGTASNGRNNYGVYGEVDNTNPFTFRAAVAGVAPTAPSSWAAWFNGPTFCSSGIWNSSDENLKTDITDIPNPYELILALQPKKYAFNQEITALELGDEYSFGFMAQDLEEILPELVTDVEAPSRVNAEGEVISEALAFKAVNYQGIIPILVAAFQEQSTAFAAQTGIVEEQKSAITALENQVTEQAATIEALQAQMNTVLQSVQAMQAKTNSCCDQKGSGEQGSVMLLDGEAPIKLAQNVPNPFAEVTRIDFELPRAAQVIMEISDAQGRPVEKLIDGQMPQGMHTIQWDGSQLAPGMYFYSLYANGELLTKKMIKR